MLARNWHNCNGEITNGFVQSWIFNTQDEYFLTEANIQKRNDYTHHLSLHKGEPCSIGRHSFLPDNSFFCLSAIFWQSSYLCCNYLRLYIFRKKITLNSYNNKIHLQILEGNCSVFCHFGRFLYLTQLKSEIHTWITTPPKKQSWVGMQRLSIFQMYKHLPTSCTRRVKFAENENALQSDEFLSQKSCLEFENA